MSNSRFVSHFRARAVRRVGLGAALVAAAACAALKDVQAVATVLEARYGEPVGVNVMNGAQLTLTFVGARYAAAPAAERERVAREAAGVAYAEYPGRDGLETITVAFPGAQGAAGFTWSAAEVRKAGPTRKPTPAAARPGA